MPPTKDLFASSSDDDDDELDRQLATANARERRRDPHAFAKFSKKRESVRSRLREAQADAESTSDSASEAEVPNTSEEQPMTGSVVQKREGNVVKESTKEMAGIRINKQYAAKYDEVKRQKELRQLTEKYGDRLSMKPHGGNGDDEEEDEEEDDDGVLLTEHKELSFAKAFLAVRSAASGKGKLREESEQVPNFFPSAEDQLAENNAVFTRAMAQKEVERRRRFTLSDEYRRGMTNSSVMGEVGEEGENHPQGDRKIKPQSAKERQLRESFLKSVSDSTETFAVQPVPDSNNRGEHINTEKGSVTRDILAEAFSIRGKKRNEKKRNSAPDDKADTYNADGAEAEEEPQSEGIEDDADEEFIRDYFVNELWKPGKSKSKKPKQKTTEGDASSDDSADHEEDEAGNNYAMLAQLAREEEDERFYADAEAWEREYQDRAYRHQDEAAEHIQSFPRPIGQHAAGLLRRSAGESGRKEARLRRLQRMEEMRERQVEELKRLKTLKRQEIEDQRALIAAVAGLSEATKGSVKSKKSNNNNNNKNNKNKGSPLNEDEEGDEEAIKRVMELWAEKDLDEDFDPKEFDKKMAKLFDEEYYDEKNVDANEMAFFHEELDQEDDEGDDEESDGEDHEEGAVEDVPDLYNAKSLEDAIQMSASIKLDNARTQNRDTADARGVPVADPMLSNDPLALLYPSAALRDAEEADFRQVAQRLGSTHNSGEDREAETLRQLRADLKEREKEYWELHHDSTRDGGAVRTRFKYREVPAEDFLLPVEEILARDDRQLNMIVPMSCYAAYLDKGANARDRERVNRRARRGFREVDSSRRSRRYGDVARTALVDMNMSETAGKDWAERVRDGLRRSRVENELDETEARSGPQVKRERKEIFAGKGSRGIHYDSSRPQQPGRVKQRQDGDYSARQAGRGRGGRGRGR